MPTFCRHGRLEATCPICSRKAREGQAAEPRRATPRPARSPSSGRGPSSRGGDLRVRRMARAADDGYEHELLPGLRSSARRRAPGRRDRLRGGAAGRAVRRPARPLRRRGPRLRRRGGHLAGLPHRLPLAARGRGPVGVDRRGPHELGVGRAADARGRRARAAHRARPRARRLDAAGLSRVGRARRLAGAGLHRRPRVARPAPLRPRLRAPVAARLRARARATSCWSSSGASASTTCARGRCTSPPTRSTPPSSPPSACSASATRCCCSAARPSSSRPSASRSRRSTSALTNWSRPEGERITAGATVGVEGPRRDAIGAAAAASRRLSGRAPPARPCPARTGTRRRGW